MNGDGMKPLLTVSDLARILSVPKSSIYRWSAAGKIPTLKVGALIRFDVQEVKASIKSSQGGGHDATSTARES
jgi:excisionase family DNA binding protein